MEKFSSAPAAPVPLIQTRKGPIEVMATIEDDDERLLARIGYQQVRDTVTFLNAPRLIPTGTAPGVY